MPLHSHTLQPQSSATRDVELQYDKVDAEASSILIALANHNRKEQHASEMAAAAAMKSLAAATGQDLSCASFLAVRPLSSFIYVVLCSWVRGSDCDIFCVGNKATYPGVRCESRNCIIWIEWPFF